MTRGYLRDVILPEWWDDEVAMTPAGYAEGLLIVSRRLGLDLGSLGDESRPIETRDFGTCKFKKAAGTHNRDLALARSIATRAAQLAAGATSGPTIPLPATPEQARAEILGRGKKWVGLAGLVDYCWGVGVPVLHLSAFPRAIRRPDGLAARIDGRPAIVLCKKATHPAWLLFILAHELGHVALGHVADGSVLVDESMGENEADDEERAANAFAVALLRGDPGCRLPSDVRWPKADRLALAARDFGLAARVDPGHLILDFARRIENFPLGQAALKSLGPSGPGGPGGPALIRERMFESLDWSCMSEDSGEFLGRITEG